MIIPLKIDLKTVKWTGARFLDGNSVAVWMTQGVGYASPGMQKAYPYGFHQGSDWVYEDRGARRLVFPEGGIIKKIVDGQPLYGSGFGNYIEFVGNETGWYHRLAHLEEIDKNLKVGDFVKKGQEFATIGRTGYQRPKGIRHLHWDSSNLDRRYSSSEVSKEKYINQFQDNFEKVLNDLEMEKNQIQKENEKIVDMVYRLILGREGDKEGKKSWSEWLWYHPVSELLSAIMKSKEAKEKKEKLLLYLGMNTHEQVKFYNEDEVNGLCRTFGEILSDKEIIK